MGTGRVEQIKHIDTYYNQKGKEKKKKKKRKGEKIGGRFSCMTINFFYYYYLLFFFLLVLRSRMELGVAVPCAGGVCLLYTRGRKDGGVEWGGGGETGRMACGTDGGWGGGGRVGA